MGSLLVALGFSIGLSAVAGALVAYVQPLGAGSGIPEMKTYLNGLHLPGLLRIQVMRKMVNKVERMKPGKLARV